MQSTAAEVVTEPTLVQCLPEHLPTLWPLFSSYLGRIEQRSRGRWDEQSLATAAMSGRIQVWVAWDGEDVLGVVGTDVGTVETGKQVCTLLFCAGQHFDRWFHLISVIEDWARHIGCEIIEATASKGLAKRFGDYALTHVVLEKDL